MQCADILMVATSSNMQDKLCWQHTEDDGNDMQTKLM